MTAAATPRKRPLQARSRATCDAILEAAARILEGDGARGLTTNRIAEVAGVSVGSLYQYYPDRAAILAELVRKMRAQMYADLQAAVQSGSGASLQRAVRELVRAAILHHAPRPVLAARLEEAERDLDLDEETRALKAQINALIAEVLRSHGTRDAMRAAHELTAMTRAIVDAAVEAGDQGFDALADRVAAAALGYLGAPARNDQSPSLA